MRRAPWRRECPSPARRSRLTEVAIRADASRRRGGGQRCRVSEQTDDAAFTPRCKLTRGDDALHLLLARGLLERKRVWRELRRRQVRNTSLSVRRRTVAYALLLSVAICKHREQQQGEAASVLYAAAAHIVEARAYSAFHARAATHAASQRRARRRPHALAGLATFEVVVTGVRRSLTREWPPLVSAMAQMMRDTDPSYALRYKVRTYASSRRSHRSKLSTSRETAAD